MNNEIKVRVGVGVYVIRNGKFLIGKRLNSHGENSYACPGGHMEFGETWEETAIREFLEETGLKIENPRFLGITNDIFEEENKHYITISVLADCPEGEPEILEPNKCSGWHWVDLNNLPKEKFTALENLLKSEFKEKLENELAKNK